MEDFLQSIVPTPESLALLQEQALKSGASHLTREEIEEEIAAVRRTKARKQV